MEARFDIQDLLPIGITFIVLGIAIAYGLDVMEDTKNEIADKACVADGGYWNADLSCDVSASNSTAFASSSSALNATSDAITGVATLPEKLPTIVSVVVAAVIIGILVRYLLVK